MGERAGIFDDEVELDVSGFAPKAATAVKKQVPPQEAVRAVSEAVNFVSREPVSKKKQSQRSGRRYRTGRDVQINLKVRQQTRDVLHTIADEKGWVLAEVMEHALAALQRDLGTQE